MEVSIGPNIIKEKIINIYKRKTPPDNDNFLILIKQVNQVLRRENPEIRPYTKDNISGGIIKLNQNLPVIILSDIHARLEYLLNAFLQPDNQNETVLDKLENNRIQVICVGDGLHSEARGIKRWMKAFEEYKEGYARHKFIDLEMKEGLGVMEIIMEMKINFSDNFHFLKGNHENISNENIDGNFPFRKFCFEGAMTEYYMKKFYSKELFNFYYLFEKNLPLFVIGKNFLISHCEPVSVYNEKDILNYRKKPAVVQGLTWTDNGVADENNVSEMLNKYIEKPYREKSYYFGGHRPICNSYKLRAKNRYVQIHNPDKYVVASIDQNQDIDLDSDIIIIEDQTDQIIKQEK